MRELVFNDASNEGSFLNPAQSIEALCQLSVALSVLVDSKLASKLIRFSKSPAEIVLSDKFTFYEAMISIQRDPKNIDNARFLLGLSQKVPIEDDLTDEELECLVEWSVENHAGCLSLLLCVASDHVLVTLSAETQWHLNPLELLIVKKDSAGNPFNADVEIDNVFSEASSTAVKVRSLKRLEQSLSPSSFWLQKTALFPNLDFAPSVLKNLQNLSTEGFSAAISRISEIDAAANVWNDTQAAAPKYSSKITGESQSTMEHYGNRRVFVGADGVHHTYEKHARIHDGFRIHLREDATTNRIEIGYVGPHLPTVKFN